MKDQPPENLPPNINSMVDTLSYPSTPNGYAAPSNYYSHSHGNGHVHVVAPPPRSETQQRKRPKYTRSKTGCLTCRVKKIKCDETKPICMRCTHGQRDCTWPEGVPSRKKVAPRKDQGVDGRPSTAESSGLSETSTPPTRDSTPPRRAHDYSLPPVVARRHSEPFVPPLVPEPELARRQLAPHPYQLHHHSQSSVLPMVPEMPTYHSTRYDTTYGGSSTLHTTPRLPGPSHQSSHPLHLRSMTQSHHSHSHSHSHSQQAHQSHGTHHWTQAQMLPPLNPMEPYYHTTQERDLVGHSSSDHHPRYQC